MKTLKTDFQNELISYLESLKGKDGIESPAYFLEELRPKRVRRKVPVLTGMDVLGDVPVLTGMDVLGDVVELQEIFRNKLVSDENNA